MLKPVYALIGDDSFLQTQKLLELLEHLPPETQRIDVDGEQAELAEVLDELRSFAMFSAAKVVVVRAADEFVSRFREHLEKYAAQPSTSGTLILRLSSLPANQRIYKLIDKLGGIHKCEPPRDLVRWITDQARSAHKLTISSNAARMLADLIGSDLGRLDNELAKLAIQSKDGRIDIADITGTVAFQREQKMWDMTNALAAGNPTEAMRQWRHLVQSDSSAEFRAVTWLTMWLETVRKALAMKQRGINVNAISQQLRIWPREIQQPFFRTAEALGEQGVARGLNLLAEIDYQTKTGVGDAVENVERFLMSVAPGAR